MAAAPQKQSDLNNDEQPKKAFDPMELLDIDAILDAIPEERKGKKYTDMWDPTKLDEELKQHPFFMKEPPKEGEPVPPLIEALQNLKYSEDDNTPDELAKNYKEDGLFHFKLKKYRVAVLCFTEGIRSAESPKNSNPNPELTAQLYNNRAASQFHLQNYRSALIDCEKAIQLKNGYFKPVMKAIECCEKLEKWDRVIYFCNLGDKIQPKNADIRRIKLQTITKQEKKGATERKRTKDELARIQMRKKLMSLIEARNIVCYNKKFLKEDSAHLGGKTVQVVEDDRLTWPVLLHYPQFSQSDFVEAFHEDSNFIEHLTEILENERPGWDEKNEYHAKTVDIYFVNYKTGGHTKVNPEHSLGQTLQHKTFVLPSNGVLNFFIMARNDICQKLLERLHLSDS